MQAMTFWICFCSMSNVHNMHIIRYILFLEESMIFWNHILHIWLTLCKQWMHQEIDSKQREKYFDLFANPIQLDRYMFGFSVSPQVTCMIEEKNVIYAFSRQLKWEEYFPVT